MTQLEEAYAAFQAWLDTDEHYQDDGDLLAAIDRYAAESAAAATGSEGGVGGWWGRGGGRRAASDWRSLMGRSGHEAKERSRCRDMRGAPSA